MRRGGALYPPRPRAPAASRQAPPFPPSEGQVFHADAPRFKHQGLGAVHGLPRKEGNLRRERDRRQALAWDEQSLRSRGQPAEASPRRGEGPQPRRGTAF